jgi:streptogramin lyase
MAGLGGATLHQVLARRLSACRWIACLIVLATVAAIPVANAVLLHRVGPRHTRRPVEALAVRALQHHPGQTIVFLDETKNQNLQALLETYENFGGRFLVAGRDELEVPPPPCGHRLQVPLLWTADQNTAEILQRQLGSTHRMGVERDPQPDASVRAWLFTPATGGAETAPRACFADAALDLEIAVGGDPTDQPWDVAADSSGNVFVAVRGANQIHAFSSDGRLRSTFGPGGSPDDRFGELSAVVVDSRDSLWVLDSAAEKVFRFNAEGEPMSVEISAVGYTPRGLGLAPNDDLLVAVTGSGEVRRYHPDGELVASIATTNDRVIELREPTDAAVTPDGELFVLDAGRQTVWRLAADGHPVTSWHVEAGVTAASSGGLAYHPTGHVLVTEPSSLSFGEVSFFHLDGTACARWTIPGVSAPLGIDVDRVGRVLLAFPESKIVRVYSFGTARRH